MGQGAFKERSPDESDVSKIKIKEFRILAKRTEQRSENNNNNNNEMSAEAKIIAALKEQLRNKVRKRFNVIKSTKIIKLF
jgi:hypothetical protein